MSKGSARRPGSGYADGWSRIFEGKTEQEHQVEQDAKNQRLRDALDKVPLAKQHATIRPIVVGTCGECKHWSEANQPMGFGTCGNADIGSYHERGDSRIWLAPPVDFGCNRWERKP